MLKSRRHPASIKAVTAGYAHTLSPDWTPDKEDRKAVKDLGLSDADIDRAGLAFRFFHTKGIGGLWRLSEDGWRAAWRKWVEAAVARCKPAQRKNPRQKSRK